MIRKKSNTQWTNVWNFQYFLSSKVGENRKEEKKANSVYSNKASIWCNSFKTELTQLTAAQIGAHSNKKFESFKLY